MEYEMHGNFVHGQRMSKPARITGSVEEYTQRKVVVYFTAGEPWHIRDGIPKGGYIRPDFVSATYVDGKIDTVAMSGQRCRKNGERWGEKRHNDYFTWRGKYVQPAPEWLYEALIDNGADHTAVALTWGDCG